MKTTILLLAFAIIIAGCQYVPFQQRKETIQIPETNIGTQGVEISFPPQEMPREVFEKSTFTMPVTLANKGIADIEKGVYVISYDPTALALQRPKGAYWFNLRGKSIFNPKGEERTLSFIFSTLPLGPQVERMPTTLTITTCYPYKTSAQLDVCIDTDILGREKTKVCQPKTQTYTQGQGAPITITSIETKMKPIPEDERIVRPEFIIKIKNQGRGEVVAPGMHNDACSGRGGDIWNQALVQASLTDMPLSCNPSMVRLKREEDARIVCTTPEGQGIDVRQGTYITPLAITIDYSYVSALTTWLTILKP